MLFRVINIEPTVSFCISNKMAPPPAVFFHMHPLSMNRDVFIISPGTVAIPGPPPGPSDTSSGAT